MEKTVRQTSFSALRRRAAMVMLTLAALFASVPASADTGSKVTLNAAEASLESVLKQIEQQTGYHFFYSRNVID